MEKETTQERLKREVLERAFVVLIPADRRRKMKKPASDKFKKTIGAAVEKLFKKQKPITITGVLELLEKTEQTYFLKTIRGAKA